MVVKIIFCFWWGFVFRDSWRILRDGHRTFRKFGKLLFFHWGTTRSSRGCLNHLRWRSVWFWFGVILFPPRLWPSLIFEASPRLLSSQLHSLLSLSLTVFLAFPPVFPPVFVVLKVSSFAFSPPCLPSLAYLWQLWWPHYQLIFLSRSSSFPFHPESRSKLHLPSFPKKKYNFSP